MCTYVYKCVFVHVAIYVHGFVNYLFFSNFVQVKSKFLLNFWQET